MSDDLILLLTRRASGEVLGEADQATLEAALLEDPELLDLLSDAQIVQDTGALPQQTWLVWMQRAAFSGLFLALFSLGLAVGGTATNSSGFFASQDPTYALGEQLERRALQTSKDRRS